MQHCGGDPQKTQTCCTFIPPSCTSVTELVTFGVMLLVMQKDKCCKMLSMLWYCCWRVVRRYFCRALAMEGKIAWAASRGSIISPGAFCCSSAWRRLI